MFRHRQALRRWAAQVLLLWLFGVGAGMANACIATGQAGSIAGADDPLMAAVEAHHEVATHDHAKAHRVGWPSHDDHAPAHRDGMSKANCQDFCAKATVSIPPLKSALDDAQSHAAIAMTAMPVFPMTAFAPLQWQVLRRDGVRAPPIPIAFLRLTL